MKKVIVFASVFAALIGVSMSPSVFAQHDMGMAEGDSDHAQCAMGGKKGMMDKGMMGGMMMKGDGGMTDTADSGSTVTAAVDPADHAAHH